MESWQPGKLLQDGRFIIEKVLGGGGFGITYRIREQRSGNLFVLKTLNNSQQSRADFQQRQVKFVNEALRLGQCIHPYIVRVHEVIQEGELWAMVMEHIDGDDLAVYVMERGFFPEQEALKYITQIGQALELVHKRGFLHRDIKPSNILLRPHTEEAVLIDFGLAREFVQGQTRTMTGLLTEGYGPIEQYENRGHFGAYTDVYALAATLYNLLTGEMPFPSKFRRHAPLPPPKQLNPNISDRVNNAIVKGMAFEPQDRPQTVQEWLNLLTPEKINPAIVQPPLSKPHREISNPQLSTPAPSTPEILIQKFQFEYAKIDKNLQITHHPAQAEFFTEDLGQGVKLEMVYIPGGTFMMGSPENEQQRTDSEGPQHQVTIQPFFMGKYQVTQAQWRAVAALPKVNRELKPDPSYFKGDKRPVEQISWYDAVEFCARLGNKIGKNYRLPSESEWEYACRAGTKTPFYFGETITTELANYNGNYTYGNARKGKYRTETTNVGCFRPNVFGLYDMHGNLWEWCADAWYVNYLAAPTNGEARKLENDNHFYVLRGGSWFNNPENCRSAFRDNNDDYLNLVGFRVVCVFLPRT
jgi:formylglycine-generating enzyme required for sulfatase activity